MFLSIGKSWLMIPCIINKGNYKFIKEVSPKNPTVCLIAERIPVVWN